MYLFVTTVASPFLVYLLCIITPFKCFLRDRNINMYP
jgi:hypothetical protein